MVLEKIISAIASVTMMSSVVPSGLNLSVLPEDSVVEQASEGEEDTTWTVVDYTQPENQTLSEEDLALMHEDNWLNQEVVKQVESKSGHSLDQLDLNDFLAIQSIMKTSDSSIKQIPESIKFLSNLTSLNLRKNQIASIPSTIGNLTKLNTLDFYFNRIAEVPDSIGNLTNLTKLKLNQNKLTQLPDSIGNLTNLTRLDLNENHLTSLPDSIGNLTNLTILNLTCGDRGELNKLTTLPNSIGNLTKLTQLDLSYLGLTSLPDTIGNLTSLTEIIAYNNKLTSIPESIGNLRNLTKLDLNSNKLNSVPDSIWNLTNLTYLDLNNNELTSISDSLGNLTELTYLGLRINHLTSIPESIGTLTKLTQLYLGSNKLPLLPDSITNLINLTYLDLSSNKLTDSIDISKFTKPNVSINVSDNYLTKIPEHSPNASLLTNPNCIMDKSESNQYGLNEEGLGYVYENNAIHTRAMKIGDSFDLNKFHLGLMTYYKNYGQMFGIKFVTSDPEQKSIVEDLKIFSSNTEVVDNNGIAKSLGSCRVIVYLPGGEDGSKFSISRVYDVTVCNPVDDFISTPSKDKIESALDELDSKKDSGEDISAKKDEVINKGKDYVGSDSVSKDDKIEYIDKIIDNLVDEDKKVVTRDDVVSTITVLPSEDRKQPIDTLVDRSQDTSDTFIDGGNQLTLKVNDTSLEVGQSLDLEDVTEVTYNGVNLDSSQIDSLELIPSEEGYFTGTKALKAGRTRAKVKLTSEALAIQTYNGGNENPIISNEMNVTIEQPVISSGTTSASGDVTVKYELNETAQLSLSTQVVDFGVSTGISEVSQETPMTATVKSSTVYDLDLSPQTNLVNEEDPSVEIPSTKASISFNDAVDFTALPVPNSSLNLVTNGNATTALENRSKVYNMNFKIGDVIGSKAGKYTMPIRITLTQK